MTRRKMQVERKPTHTILVERAVTAAGDFVNVQGLKSLTGLTTQNVTKSLGWLKKCQVVDSLESGGSLWWFATSAPDTRHRKMEVRAVEGPRRVYPRKKRPAPGLASDLKMEDLTSRISKP